MTNDDLNQIRGVVKEEVNTALAPVVKKLDALWDQTAELTKDMTEVKETQDLHTTAFKRIEVTIEKTSEGMEKDLGKVDKRLTEAESHLGIVPPPELTMIR